MSQTVSFEHLLGPAGFSRVRFEKHSGRILSFAIQLECLIGGEWHPVIRYDTAHGFAHCDVLHPTKEAQKIDLNLKDYNAALTFAQRDIAERWRAYCERFEKWLREKSESPKTKS